MASRLLGRGLLPWRIAMYGFRKRTIAASTRSMSIPDEPDRDNRLMQVVEEVVRRRVEGESVADESVTDTHSDLMPELGESLRALRRVEAAQAKAKGENASSSDLPSPDEVENETSAGLPADSFPGYDIISEIHRGGQGVVYRSTQQATGRDVAVKVMREGPFLGPRDKARFEREVRILGRLRHPNIVTIHDSGIAAGCHYFVMDYIPGQPLDSYMVDRNPSIEVTLRLFAKICSAVHAAHLRGVIHRDLKPSNIRIDQRGEPHILDFGLAKIATEEMDELSELRRMTMTGQFVGSLPWASPEQAEGRPDRIDIRTDVYSLGVILFNMLTGRFPYPVIGNIRDVLSNIIENDPVRPRSIYKEINEDVETIILKCLAKEPERRYQSAVSLAEDVERYLTNQPILARSPSTIYQLKKLIVRHKLPFVFLTLILVLLVGAAVWMSALYAQAAAERTRATAAELEAKREARTARAINDFLINDMLASAEPEIARGRKVTVEEVLENASGRINDAFSNQPVTRASVLATIGRTYLSLGLYEAAREHLREAEAICTRELGDEHPQTLQARIALIETLRRQDNLDEAETLAERTLQLCRRILGEDHLDTLEAAFQRAILLERRGRRAEAVELHDQTLQRRRRLLGDAHPDTLASFNEWGNVVLLREGRSAEAEDLFRQVLQDSRRVLGDEHPKTYVAMSHLGTVLTSQRRFEEGEPLLRKGLLGLRRVLGDEHPDTLSTMMRLGTLLKEQDRAYEAVKLLRQAISISGRVLGDEHPLSHDIMQTLGNALMRHGSFAEAADGYRKSLRIARSLYGDDNGVTAHSIDALSVALARLGHYEEAVEGHLQALEVHRRVLGQEYTNTCWSLRCLVRALAAQGKLEQARPVAEELLELRRQVAQRPDPNAYQLNCYARALLTTEPADLRDPALGLQVALEAYGISTDSYHYNRFTLALAYEANNDVERAIEMINRALDHVPVEGSTERREYEATLVRFLENTGDSEAAQQVYRDTLTVRREQLPEVDPDIARSLDALGELLIQHGKHAQAEPILRESLQIRELLLTQPQHAWQQLTLEGRAAQTASALGASLTGQGRFAEAEPLLLEGHDRIHESALAATRQARRTVERLVELYEASGKSDLAARYRARLSDIAAGEAP